MAIQPDQYGQYKAEDWWSLPLSERQNILKYGSTGKAAEINNLPTNLASMADPYKAQRDQLIQDPNAALSQSPFFKFMQERALAATQGQNRAGGFQNSGRGLLALQESGQKSAAGYYFPYLQALGHPGAGANAFFEAYKYLNPQISGGGGGGGSSGIRQARQPLASMAAGNVPATAPASASPSTGLPYWENPYGSGMGPVGPLPGYGPSTGAGTGSMSSDYGITGFFPGGMGRVPESMIQAGADPSGYAEQDYWGYT